ncbi:MAE_28990/MAE_18760 family HEPN-like nuclease [Methylomonas sp. BW4-1]|uniref:MAE_28990/MAE_18760 family HEPN-like nuclease n=1 Tax=Methylomonas defluvii TaxID=3045149 RepID=A0ABU4UGQ2_9GAMM|nr:MAE_28990/MAE_18760 family HEPN-like nuclease [Methylomonas sp. OY6]MDX8128659.1 MAE_28990/MAE_18760 family HEPN-like nuclease [Methylomonas sp. OY6]
MRIKTIHQFSAALNDEITWRKREIIELRMHAAKKDNVVNKTILRAGVAVLYSHWEGFIKASSELLLNYISNQKLKNDELSDVYVIQSFKSHLSNLAETKNASIAVESLRFILDEMNKSACIKYKNYVNTESNLSSEVFDRIAKSVGVDVNKYMHLYPFIDESIVNKRNYIAHGEYMDVNIDEYKRISDRVFDLIRYYKDDIENIAVRRSYAKGP